MGYEIGRKNIQLTNNKMLIVNFTLKPKILIGDEITVSAEDAKEWRKNLKIFERVFFGVKEFAKECEIINPEYLNFYYNKSSGHFRASAERSITFINNALGYKINFLIHDFTAQLDNDDVYSVTIQDGVQTFKKGKLKCFGIVQFINLNTTKKKEENKWEKNRLIAYNGSKRHFFQTLYYGNLKKEGFSICGSKSFRPKDDYNVKVDTLLKQGPNSFKKILSFPNYLKITYKKEKDEIKYQRLMNYAEYVSIKDWESGTKLMYKAENESSNQVSWIIMNGWNPIIINSNGYLESGGTIQTYGYWSWARADEWLPRNYNPIKQ